VSQVPASASPAAAVLPAPADRAIRGLEREDLGRTGGAYWRPLREAALLRARERGLPAAGDEEWRFTRLPALARQTFGPPDPAAASKATEAIVAPWRLAGSSTELVFVDGIFAPGLSRLGATRGLTVGSLRDRAETGAFPPDLGRLSTRGHVFSDLNTAFFEDGAVVEVEAGAAVSDPVHLLFVSGPTAKASVSYPRTLVGLGEGSEATLVETHAGSSGLACPVTEIRVGGNARLRRFQLQDGADDASHLSAFAARLERHARLQDFSLSLGSALARQDLDVLFAGEGGEAQLDGLLFADGGRTSDTHLLVDHAPPHCTSRELYKAIVAEKGRAIFSGKVMVRKGAAQTDAAQQSRSLLLSKEALVHSIPQLEILADDVKCRHGATSGQLDETALFYLRSRGLPEAGARGLLTVAFAAEMLQRIPAGPLRERFGARLLARLPGAQEFREAVS
jgi:Fe-S cluster assembly protein SufD